MTVKEPQLSTREVAGRRRLFVHLRDGKVESCLFVGVEVDDQREITVAMDDTCPLFEIPLTDEFGIRESHLLCIAVLMIWLSINCLSSWRTVGNMKGLRLYDENDKNA